MSEIIPYPKMGYLDDIVISLNLKRGFKSISYEVWLLFYNVWKRDEGRTSSILEHKSPWELCYHWQSNRSLCVHRPNGEPITKRLAQRFIVNDFLSALGEWLPEHQDNTDCAEEAKELHHNRHSEGRMVALMRESQMEAQKWPICLIYAHKPAHGTYSPSPHCSPKATGTVWGDDSASSL